MRCTIMFAITTALAACSGTPQSGDTARTQHTDADPALVELGWMSGTWYRMDVDSANEEMWSIPRGDTMMGTNRTISNGRAVYYEFLRIVATDDGVYYEAWPKGQAPARFRLTESGDRSVTFEDPEHDWPQRISYRRVDGDLHAEVDGTAAGERRTETWSWQAVTGH